MNLYNFSIVSTFQTVQSSMFDHTFRDVFQSSLQRPFSKVPSAALEVPVSISAPSGLFRGPETVPESVRFSSGSQRPKTGPGEMGSREVAPNGCTYPISSCLCSGSRWLRVSILIIKTGYFGTAVWLLTFTAGKISYIYGGNSCLHFLFSFEPLCCHTKNEQKHLSSRHMHSVSPTPVSVAYLSGQIIYHT